MRLFFLLPLLFLVACASDKTYFLETHTVPADFGELYGIHTGTVNILVANTYYNVSNLTVGSVRGMNLNIMNTSLVVNTSGYYRAVSQISFSDGANKEFHLVIGVNGVPQPNCHMERKVGGAGDVGSGSVTCLLLVNATDHIHLMVENPGDTSDPNIHAINLNVEEIQ